jgi:protein-L-isoaspartate(D-aspartate) O-methyltransferase
MTAQPTEVAEPTGSAPRTATIRAASEATRRAFAEEIAAVAQLESAALIEAFARVPREHFLGPGPWQIGIAVDPDGREYRTTIDDDPRHVYRDVLVALDPARELNNGQPSALARWIGAAAITAGETVLHVGCGVGYYTAIMAELVGPTGRIAAYEIDPELAARARERLAPWPQVTVVAGDGGAPDGMFDAIFVNAGATHILPGWIAAVAPGGRLVVPLTMHLSPLPGGVGAMFRADRRDGPWPLQLVSSVGIYDCTNARDPACEVELRQLLRPGVATEIHALVVTPHPRGPDCLAHLPGCCIQR